jgi:peptidoglycan/LPS O-acetylase OafA/YrhL
MPYIDGLRGLSAAYVVLFHIEEFATSRFTGALPWWWGASRILSFGDCAVAVFIVVSGYCLMLPVVADERLQLRGGRRRFAQRRLRRLGPGYVAALVASAALILAVPSMRHRSGTWWDHSLPAFSLGTIGAHLLLIHNWRREWRFGIDTPMWTVALEVQIYVVFVFALLPLWRRMSGHRPNIAVVGACLLVTAGLSIAGLAWVQPWMLVLVAVGMWAAEASNRSVGWMNGRLDLVVLGAVAVVATMLAIEQKFVHNFTLLESGREVAVGVATALLLVALRRATPTDGRIVGRIGDALSVAPCTWLGDISYSLYLVHYPILGALAMTWIYGGGHGIVENLALFVVVGGALSLLVATGFHRLFERPYLARRATRGAAAGRVSPLRPRAASTPGSPS